MSGVGAVAGKVAVVTGAGSGIGRALAVELTRRGARVAISDVSEEGLAATAAQVGGDVHQQLLDVGDGDAFAAYAAQVADRFGVVHQLYNNAGIAFSRTALESTLEDYERVLRVNLWGVINGTNAFLPQLIASGDGHLVNVSSLNGYLAQPEMSHYVTSKFAVRGFTETVRAEALAAGQPLKVSVVHPGGIKTNIANAALASAEALGMETTDADRRRRDTYNEKLLRMEPARAAKIVVDGVEAGKPRILVGTDAKFVDALVRLLPARAVPLAVGFQKRAYK